MYGRNADKGKETHARNRQDGEEEIPDRGVAAAFG
jgi:hypothetical protein